MAAWDEDREQQLDPTWTRERGYGHALDILARLKRREAEGDPEPEESAPWRTLAKDWLPLVVLAAVCFVVVAFNLRA